MNRLHLQDLVRGHYGRKIAYTNVDTITPDNIVNVVGECIGVFNWNKPIIKYLWNYYKGDQPIRYRIKVIRDDVINYIVEIMHMKLCNSKLDKLTENRYSISAVKMMMQSIMRLTI